ncbi:hypothetical protein KP509_15G039600 [Ceratopteris richardii]|uniref:Uncharacterized protein n=1 Tax=Ceratopteris richardii TaxID=49495 RepID=A0A8T2T2M8_CERRI|nr:hypothetical protein KP509_15G039600 [Ceratopteris richardii]
MENERQEGNLLRGLEIVKTALTRILQEENPLSPRSRQVREAELSKRLVSNPTSSSSQTLDSSDFSILYRLLRQVEFLEQEENRDISMKLGDLQVPFPNDSSFSNAMSIVETVVRIADSTAVVAKAAATSAGKSLEIMETVISGSSEGSKHVHACSENDFGESKPSNRQTARQDSLEKDLVKKIHRQNRLTHCILGLMVVGTAIWRFKLISMMIGAQRRLTNPFQVIGDAVSEGFKGERKKKKNISNGFESARTVLPSILGGEQEEVTKNVEKSEHSTKKDLKIGEAVTSSLDNMLSVGKATFDN